MNSPRPKQIARSLWPYSLLLAAGLVAASCGAETTLEATEAAPLTNEQATEITAATTATTAGTTAKIENNPEPAAPVTSFEPAEYPDGIHPVRIEIPAIGVAAKTIDLDLRGAEPEVPEDFGETGWYQQTRRPGEIGPAVLAGHIDSRRGPAVFAELDKLVEGDEITLFDEAGEAVSFAVVRAGQYPKGDLPAEVFGFDKALPELRLITCGGTFDKSVGHYRDNYVVYAELLQ